MNRRTLADLPPIATDDELLAWSQELRGRRTRPNRPLVATRIVATRGTAAITMQEVFSEIEEMATAVYSRRHSALHAQSA